MKPKKPSFSYPELDGEQRGIAEFATLLKERIKKDSDALYYLQYKHCKHIWVPTLKEPYIWDEVDGEWAVESSAICMVCGLNSHSWYCEKSPTKLCDYGEHPNYVDDCLHCGFPDERK